MFNGKRSHSLIGVLATVCAFYIARLKRPSWPVLIVDGLRRRPGRRVAIGWRNDTENDDRSLAGFLQFLADFQPRQRPREPERRGEDDGAWTDKYVTHETEEYGGFLLMMDTVPEKSGLRLRGQLPPHLLDLHPADPLARQAALRPRAVGRAPGSPARR